MRQKITEKTLEAFIDLMRIRNDESPFISASGHRAIFPAFSESGRTCPPANTGIKCIGRFIEFCLRPSPV